jgi:elongation factor G
LHYPVGKEQTYEGNIDLISMKAIRHVDPMGDRIDIQDVKEYQAGKYEKSSREAREIMLEELASLDDYFAVNYIQEQYLSSSFDSKDILQAIRRVTLREQAIPILCGSALKNRGVQAVLDGVINYLPSPAEKPPTVGFLKSEKITRSIGDKKLTALAYKVISNTERGSLLYARVYTGKLKSGDYVKITSQSGVYEKLGRLLRVRANEYVDVSEIHEGDIAAITGMKAARSGDTLIGKQDSEDIVLPGMDMPPPVFFCTLEAVKEADDPKLKELLYELCREDPSLSARFDEECGKLIVLGQGELHLEILRDRLLLEFNIEAKLGPLQVAYREAVSNSVKHTLRLHKPDKSEFFEVSFTINKLEPSETSERSFETALYGTNFDDLLAKVEMSLLPLERTSYTSLMNKIKEEKKLNLTKRAFEEWEEELLPLHKLSEDLQDLLIKEMKYAMLRGPLLSYPLINTQLTITDGLFSRRMTTKPILRETASKAIREAVKRAGPQIYEPIMSLEITATDEYVGDLISDLSSERRGEIVQVEKDSDSIKNIIKARVPLSEMVGYSTRLRSLTKGSGSFNMFFYKYEFVGSTKQQELVESHQ